MNKIMKKILYFSLTILLFTLANCNKESSDSGLSDGKGGSMARFTIKGDYLYTVSTDSLKIINIEDAAHPKYYPERDLKIGFDIETIFPMDTLLFIGARSGMYVYDIKYPQYPVRLSEVFHITSCDPVVAQDNYAYVTLNTIGRNCGAVPNNVLNIYDISNPLLPIRVKMLELNGPTGLGVDGNKLFVCDKGLKQFDITDPVNTRQTGDIAEIDEVDIRAAYDVIPVDGLLILVAKEGLFQFDYTGPELKFVSKFEINK